MASDWLTGALAGKIPKRILAPAPVAWRTKPSSKLGDTLFPGIELTDDRFSGAITNVSGRPFDLDKFRGGAFLGLVCHVPFGFCGFVLLASTFLCSCDKFTGAKPKRLKVGFAQIGSEGPWRDTNTRSIKEEAQKRNIDLIFFESQNRALKGGQQQPAQKEALRSFIKEKVDVIAFSPVVEQGWSDVLNEAKANGIPVILSDRGVTESDESLVATFIGSDFTEEGRRAARWLVDAADQDQEPINILEVAGTPDSAPAIQRHRGFREVLDRYQERLRIVQSVIGNFNSDEAEKVTAAFLASKDSNEIKAVFAHSDAMAFAAIRALEKSGFKPGSQVKVVSIDATDEGCQEIAKGRLNCAVECKSRLGVHVFDAAEAAAKSMALPARIIIAEGVYDQSNVGQCGHE